MEDGVPEISPMDRDLDMLRMWLLGATFEACGAKYGITSVGVFHVASKNGWSKIKAELRQRKYNAMLETFKDLTADVVLLLRTDLEKLVGETVKFKGRKKGRKLTKDERQHARQFLEFLDKANRLEDGKPTDTASSVVEHTLRLPAGVKHSFIIPPDKSVRVLPPKEVSEVIDINKLEQDLKEVENAEE